MIRPGLLIAAAALTCCAAAPVGGPPPVTVPLYEVVPGSKPLAYVVRFDPPPAYRLWWAEIRDCSGIAHPVIPFEALQFYAVGPDTTFLDSALTVYAAYGIAHHWNAITIAAPLLMRGDIVRHEMLHAITSPFRNQEHPDSIFRGACDTLVYHADGRR